MQRSHGGHESDARRLLPATGARRRAAPRCARPVIKRSSAPARDTRATSPRPHRPSPPPAANRTPCMKLRTNFGLRPLVMSRMSYSTWIWPLAPGSLRQCRSPARLTASVTALPSSFGMHSSSRMSAPADSRSLASRWMRSAASFCRPCTRKPPVLCTDCGFRPRCAHTAMSWPDQEFDDTQLLGAAFQLHHARTALLHQSHGIGRAPARATSNS